MSRLIKLDGIAQDDWALLPATDEPEAVVVPAGKVILPLNVWLAQRESLAGRENLGVWLDSHEEPEVIGEDAARFSLIAVNFPKFTDGRGYSIARLLRERYGFCNELRAIGDVLLDPLYYMKRCGFDAFVLREDKDINKAEQCLSIFNEVYQAAVDQTVPLFRRRHLTPAGALSLA